MLTLVFHEELLGASSGLKSIIVQQISFSESGSKLSEKGSSNKSETQPLAFTLDRKMLEVIAQGAGPKQKIITMGMANWTGGQLEDELEALPPRKPAMSWLVLPYDEKIVFGPQPVDLWEMCVSRAIENKTKEILSHNFKD